MLRSICLCNTNLEEFTIFISELFTRPTATDWLQSIAAIIAVRFAIKGYRQLFQDQRDTQSQLEEMKQTTLAMKDLAKAQQVFNDSTRIKNWPHLIQDGRPKYTDALSQRVLLFKIMNVGESGLIITRIIQDDIIRNGAQINIKVPIPLTVPSRGSFEIEYQALDHNILRERDQLILFYIEGLDTFSFTLTYEFIFDWDLNKFHIRLSGSKPPSD